MEKSRFINHGWLICFSLLIYSGKWWILLNYETYRTGQTSGMCFFDLFGVAMQLQSWHQNHVLQHVWLSACVVTKGPGSVSVLSRLSGYILGFNHADNKNRMVDVMRITELGKLGKEASVLFTEVVPQAECFCKHMFCGTGASGSRSLDHDSIYLLLKPWSPNRPKQQK